MINRDFGHAIEETSEVCRKLNKALLTMIKNKEAIRNPIYEEEVTDLRIAIRVMVQRLKEFTEK